MRSLAEPNAGARIRAARLAVLRGATEEAREHFTAALTLLLAVGSRESCPTFRFPEFQNLPELEVWNSQSGTTQARTCKISKHLVIQFSLRSNLRRTGAKA